MNRAVVLYVSSCAVHPLFMFFFSKYYIARGSSFVQEPISFTLGALHKFRMLYMPTVRENDKNLVKLWTVIFPVELANDLNGPAWEFKIEKEK